MNFKKLGFSLALASVMMVGFSSCNNQAKKDATLKTSIQSTLPAGISVDVKDGVATLTGEFADDIAKQAAETAVKAVAGVKSVTDNAKVKPVVIAVDDVLTSGVATAVKAFTGVTADVKDGVVTLTGDIQKTDLPKLLQAINALQPKKVDNQLNVKK